ncbi:MaoC family dehydratase [Haloarcula nitratireducens]|uniref:MaoC family dehydratase n=1 Tax=Haloarcula nitratireducens TaxID=2487749 RepID=A0AAW4PGP6_9EURY|nr:MaoC family dehydratase [Halomicroarcula nitratireducens]MBX0297257.1 MaoC family dehydratase [Halomicroarcula nitratireducens]
MFSSVVTAHRVAAATMGVQLTDTDEATREAVDRIGAGETLSEWAVERSEHDPTRLEVGDSVEFTKTIAATDVRQFAAASGDTNPLHLDEAFAEQTRFQERIGHGTLAGGLISAALARLPGLTIYLSQDLEFHNPVGIGERLTAECEIVEELADHQYRLSTSVVDDSDVLIDGEAVVLVDDHLE